jgi:hypothetical protein
MSDKPDQFRRLLVTGEPWLKMCQDWRASYLAAKEAGRQFVEAMGSTGGYENLDTHKLSGVYAMHPTPPGWRLVRGKQGKPDYMVPHDRARDKAQKAAGIEARKALDALPGADNLQPIAEAIGVPRNVNWHTPGYVRPCAENGWKREGGWGNSAAGDSWSFFFNPIQMTWFGETFVICGPNTTRQIAKIREEHPDAVITEGEWPPLPEGLREITEAEHDLLRAQWKVEQERAKSIPEPS